MENHIDDNFEGLESFGSSSTVTDLNDFLSIEDLELNKDLKPQEFPVLDQINKTNGKGTDGTVQVETAPADPLLDILNDGDKPSTTEEPVNTNVTTSTEDTDGIDLGEDETKPAPVGGTNYKDVIQSLISEGLIDEIGAFTLEDGTEVPFEEMDIDKETFVDIYKQTLEDIRAKAKEDTVSVKGISDFTQKLIDIEKHGGDVTKALQMYQQVKQPLDNIDLSDVRGQRAACYMRLKMQGIEDGVVRDLIETYEAKGELENKATEYKSQLDAAFERSLEQQKEQAIQEELAYKESIKNYRTGLNEALKAKELSETHKKKLLDIATKETAPGEFEIDNIIEKYRSNPVDAAELVMFLTDREGYIKGYAEELLKTEQKRTLKKISIISKKGNTGVIDSTKDKTDNFLFELENLK